MPNQRSPGQKLIAVPMDGKFVEYVDEALKQLHYTDRSSFIRAAIAEKLTAEGFSVPGGMAAAPYRAGKIKSYPITRHRPIILNEGVPSVADAEKAAIRPVPVILKKKK